MGKLSDEVVFFLKVFAVLLLVGSWVGAAISLIEAGGRLRPIVGIAMILALMAGWVTFLFFDVGHRNV